MKKKVLVGLLTVTTLGFAAPTFAAPAARTAREVLVDYTKQVKEAAFGKGRKASALSEQQVKAAQDSMIKELQLNGDKNNGLIASLSADSAKRAQRLENLATIVAAKRMAPELAKSDAKEGASLEAAAIASAKLLSNSSLIGARKSGKDLSNQEMAETTEALSKLESMPEMILTRFNKVERDSYTQILERHDQLVSTAAKGSAEEAFIQAIMDVKKVDKAKALEVVKKLKECV